ncbi:hypothetical protein HPB48_017954 [Haemaphysalis longicornis]|uniref:Reverse transcriptase domain-containing protein n=1 Tax=Haemaphysalis longicornis TaxID=44386 RepID=A0A9J6GKS3_HAELO|nr:hypothetical protein HPB48_017954 [Haemaphysalis longicornis]
METRVPSEPGKNEHETGCPTPVHTRYWCPENLQEQAGPTSDVSFTYPFHGNDVPLVFTDLFMFLSFIPKQGVCIGLRIAPVLSNLFLAKCDRSIETHIDTAKIAKIFRYVDDYMVVVTRSVKPEEVNVLVKTVKQTFLECSDGLNFTHELPNDGSLQFLNVS